jgi:type I restriction enzyme S subunit
MRQNSNGPPPQGAGSCPPYGGIIQSRALWVRMFTKLGYAMVRVTDIKLGNLNLRNTNKVSEEIYYQFIKNYKPKKGDIVLSRVGSYGIPSFVDTEEPFCLGQNTVVIEPKIIDKYLYYTLNSNETKKQIEDGSFGSGYKSLSLKNIKELKLPTPPTKAEQTAIATVLTDADTLITQLEKLIAKKRDIKQGVMQELLKPKQGWEVKNFQDVLKVRHGKSQRKIASDNGTYPILASGGIIGRTKIFLYDKPSVLIGRKGTIDSPQYMETPFWSVDTLFYTEIFQGYNPKFIFYMFNLIDWYSYNEASGVPSLNAKTIEGIEKCFPNFKEQTRIAQILSEMDTEIEALERKLEKYKRIRQGMMQTLLTGRIRLI